MKHYQSIILVIGLALPSLASCNRSSDAPAEGSGETSTQTQQVSQTLTLYCGRTEALVAPVVEGFEEASGIAVRVNYADTAQLAATLLEEGEGSPADLFFAQDASTLGLLEAEGLLAPQPQALLSRVASQFRSPSGGWIGTSGRARVLAYNTSRIAPADLPARLDDLTAPSWQGRVGWAPENASFQSFVSAMVRMRGVDGTAAWLRGVQSNQPRAYPSNTPAVLAVSRGEIDVALTNHYYLYRLRDEHGSDFPVANHYFRDGQSGALVNVSGIAQLRTASQPEAARAFIDYLLSNEAQSHFARENHEFPVVGDVPSPADLPALGDLNAPALDLALLADLETAVRLLRDSGALQ